MIKILIILLLFSVSVYGQKNALILNAGQSQARGGLNSHGEQVRPDYLTAIPGVFAFRQTADGYDVMNFTGSNNNQCPGQDGHMSYELAFCKDLLSYGFDSVYFCEYAINGAFLADTTADNWNPGKVNSYYDLAKGHFKSARDWLVTNSITYDTIIIIWFQHTSDGQSSVCAWAYETNLTNLITGIDAWLGNDPKFMAWIIQMHNSTGAPYGNFKNIIRTAEANVCAALGYRLIDIDSFPLVDAAHHSSLVNTEMGQFWAYWYIYYPTIRYKKPLIY